VLSQRITIREGTLRAPLDNMPGALVYTDEDLKIVFCNERFKEMYPAPRELLHSGRPYPDFLRFLAENGYYGAGDVDAWWRIAMIYVRSSDCNFIPQSIHNLCTLNNLIGALSRLRRAPYTNPTSVVNWERSGASEGPAPNSQTSVLARLHL
jgi:PAS domain-containing protein